MAAEALEKSVLEGKDREQLMAIAQALGVKSVSRAKKAELIDKILEQTSTPEPVSKPAPRATERPAARADVADKPAKAEPRVVLGPDGEPLAEWEIELAEHEGTLDESAPSGGGQRNDRGPRNNDGQRNDRGPRNNDGQRRDFQQRDGQQRRDFDGEGGGRNRRRRRRNKGRRDDMGPQGDDRYEIEAPVDGEPISTEPVAVNGYLDLRDEGYGFLRVRGYLPHRDDAYISVKQTRQFGLRKGDHVTGMARPAGRGEKNPALLEIHSINGKPAESVKGRPRFEDLTPLFPDEKLRLEDPQDPANMTSRIIDLISPIGKGQRGLIVSPPKAGKTTIMKTIVTSIEKNNPEVDLIVLLIDERPEEVTDMKRTVRGEVISSTFDRPSEEHTIVAEMAIEKAKRMVEAGRDVVVVLDGITRLSRAYNLAAPATGRIMSGGIDAGALYPPKKFFGAARNVEEGGSLTILATCLVETNSRMDDAIFEEFKGTGNMELRLDRKLAERRIYPAIDVDASSTRHEELLFDRKQLQLVWKLRRVLSGLAADGNAGPGLELLIDRLKSFRNNDEFLAEIAKQPSM
ncbi:MAG: transcription termination factor Rho [Actinobacteria bacterium]|nr:transcription termination factor Rho [Actinomycetota bacterium]NBP53873.1 transcription termination factor Rho [Actinomycetota bacterium]